MNFTAHDSSPLSLSSAQILFVCLVLASSYQLDLKMKERNETTFACVKPLNASIHSADLPQCVAQLSTRGRERERGCFDGKLLTLSYMVVLCFLSLTLPSNQALLAQSPSCRRRLAILPRIVTMVLMVMLLLDLMVRLGAARAVARGMMGLMVVEQVRQVCVVLVGRGRRGRLLPRGAVAVGEVVARLDFKNHYQIYYSKKPRKKNLNLPRTP